MLRPAAALLALGCLCLSACGGGGSGNGTSSQTSAGTSTAAPPAGSLEALWRSASSHASLIEGSSDYQPGRNRVSFLLVDAQARVVSPPTVVLRVATALTGRPFERAVAHSEPIGVPGGASAGVGSIFVADVDLPRAGKYWVFATPGGSVGKGGSVGALANLVVNARPDAPGVGSRAIPVDTPTLASAHGKLRLLSTATHPDPRLYRLSVRQALARHLPFVLTFATPKFCQSRTCGPVVDVVDAVARKLAATPVRFIHVEIYRDNDPAKGFNRWVSGPGSWHLPTEPFTFVVDRSGVIRAKLSGAFSVGELERAVRSLLLRAG
jgi:hypothetical protein